MTLWPRSLFGRNALLIAALLVLGQLLSALLVRELILKPRFEMFGDGLARNVSAVRAGLLALPAAERTVFVDQFNQRAMANVTRGPAGEFGRALLTPLERSFVRAVSQRVAAEGAEVIWRREAGGSLAVRLSVDASTYWLVLPGVLPAHEFTGAWLAASLASVALALVGAMLIQRRLHRPLAAVVEAARAMGRGAAPQPLAEDGPSEVAALGHGFNQMVASLARAERERALMLAGISHDLRTPLTKLRLGVEIIASASEPALMASMTRSIEEMDGIVGQFLAFARGDVAEAETAGDLDALARDAVAARADHGQAISLARSPAQSLAPTPPPRARLRPQAMQRCLDNLIENAVRHGQPPVCIATGTECDWVWIEVGDQGDGMRPDEAEALKQPFRRAQAARNGTPGAGLGLAIVDRLVRAQGGRLELLPNAPRGLRARISLPRA